MKNFYLLLLLFSTAVWSQELTQLEGTWVSKESDVIVVRDTMDGESVIATLDKTKEATLYIYKNLLRFGDFSVTAKQLTYDFKVLKINDKELWLKPVSDKSKEFYNKRKTLKFVKQEYNTDEGLKFEKVIFHSTLCYGVCPIINLEIDSNKNAYIHYQVADESGERYGKAGYFSGQLSDSLFNELMHILKTSNIRTLYFPERHGSDAPIKTIILYYNGERKCLKSMFPPEVADRLIAYLYSLPKKAKLAPTEVVRELEDKP